MAVIDPPSGGGGFRVDMLWNDSRYRSTFIQIVALLATITVFWLIVDNVVANLARVGKDFAFNFMTNPASYDINQRPLDYTSRDSHARAAIIGIINTLLVAVVGCVLATIIGVLAGIARLSRNLMLRAIMSVYVEVIRNVPLLIQILLVMAVITETLPVPRDFRGEDAVASMLFWDSVALTNRGFYFPALIFQEGSWVVVAAFIAGIVASVVFSRYAAARQAATGDTMAVLPINAAIIILTPLAIFFVSGMPIGLDLPAFQDFNFQGGLFLRNSYLALVIALAVYTGAFIAENVRAGIMAVNRGQTEAASALGLQPGRTMSLVILPQALRIIIPPLISQYLNLTKNSSLALFVGYMDLTGTLMGITLNQTGREFETLGLGMAVYLTISLSIAGVMNLYNEDAKLVERTSGTGGGLSLSTLLAGFGGPWERISKGDAQMRPTYGLRLEMNLFWLFYAGMLLLMVDYVFIQGASELRPSYWDWGMGTKVAALTMTVAAFAALATCLFKNPRFIDIIAAEFCFFVLAVLLGFPFGALIPGVDGTMFVFATAAMRLAIFGYTVLGPRPNLTFFHRVRQEA
ncbi:MAG: ABC transporter permease subunit [Pseudomonadota bacterium]